MTPPAPGLRYVPADLDAGQFDQLQPLFRELLDRPITSQAELEQWLEDFSELAAVIDEFGSRRYIDKSCHTDDAEIERRYLHFVEQVEPQTKPLMVELQKKYLACPFRSQLVGPRYAMLTRRWEAEVALFRPANVPLETEATRQINEYDKLCGAMLVEFRGHEYTLQQMGRFLEEPDRETRQAAWEVSAERRLADQEAITAIFDRLLTLRQQIAVNAGFDDYRGYMWKQLKRFDYTPEDALRFDEAIATVCVPLVQELDRQRAADLGLERLRPWDLQVDPQHRPPLRPFAEDQVPQFIEKTRAIFHRLSPSLADDFDQLRQHNNLDLASRKDKQPGGYQTSLEASRQPFIFMNAAGVQRDVETLLHEGGHAFHYLASRTEPLVFLRSAPMEFCEVASMSMELLGSEHFDLFYDAAGAARAKRSLLEGIVRFLPWMATIDAFQHWLYTHPGHTHAARTVEWMRLNRLYGSRLDWSGLERFLAASWQRQLHLFHVPFYYIEYGIAQLGALQLWLKSRHDPQRALSHYRAALKLGGTRPLPELFAAAGIRFDFSQQTLRPLLEAIGEELAELPR